MAMVVESATAIDLDDRRSLPEQRWPVGWSVILAATLSVGLWGAIFLGIPPLLTIFAAA